MWDSCRSPWASCFSEPPNKRLKLAGAYRPRGSGVLCPWRGMDCRPTALRRRAGRPQLKRDPLGAITATSDMIDRDSPVSNAAARIAGAALIIAALAAGYGLVTYVPGPDVRLTGRVSLYIFFGGTGLVALIVGFRLIRSDEPELTLPPIVLRLGVVLLLLAAVVQVVLFFLLHSFGSLEGAITLGVGGAIGALRLLKRRRQTTRIGK